MVGLLLFAMCLCFDTQSSFKKKAHKLYSVERKLEIVYNFALRQQEMSEFGDVRNINDAFTELAINDDIKFFKDFWENNNPNKSLLMNQDKDNDKIFDNAVVNILTSETGQIHNYLKTEFGDIYTQTILYYINDHKSVRNWHSFMTEIGANEIQLRFIKRLIAVLSQNDDEEVNDLVHGKQILSALGSIRCLK